jgi:hypothetical protein
LYCIIRNTILFLLAAPALAESVSISGSVVDAAGSPVAGTIVTYNNSPATMRDRVGHTRLVGPVVHSTLRTGPDGTFSVSGIPPGVYWLCAEPLAATQIRSCDWGYGGTKVDLTTETAATSIRLQLHAGVMVTFDVNDANGRIQDYGATPGNFRIFVVDGTWIKPARPAATAAASRQYTVVVPSVRTLQVMVDTKLKVVNPQAPAGLAADLPPNTITVNGQPVTYKLTVQ